jgi:hypothetical protein
MHRGGEVQRKLLEDLVTAAKDTSFGQAHDYSSDETNQDFISAVPVADYEDIKHYIEKVIGGEKNVLWPGTPIYFSKTSGTTSGTKYIPITKDSISNHINGARDALLNYVYHTGESRFLDGKLIFLSGSPELDNRGSIPVGRLSGIVNHHIPGYLKSNQMPSYQTNCIEDWEEKVDTIIEETLTQNMTLISGIPPWVQMYFDRIRQKTGQSIIGYFLIFRFSYMEE